MTRTLLLSSCFLGLSACATAPEILPFEVMPVPAAVETDPMVGKGDRADDPAIWVHPEDASRSLILGTNKDEGLHVYTLDGSEKQFLDVGRLNNIDLRGDIAVGSNDEVSGLSWFAIDATSTSLTHLGDTAVTQEEPYGVCAGIVDEVYYGVPTYKDGTVEFWAATSLEAGNVATNLERTLKFSGQLEGCVFHEPSQRLFIGEEEFGIWVLDLSKPDAEPEIYDTIASANGLVMDVEGLSIWDNGEGDAYLVASAQAADRFVVYDLGENVPVGIFTVAASRDGLIDKVTHTDGLDINAAALPDYPEGLVVVQDDGNPRSGVDQNFKLVGWAEVSEALGLRAD